MESKLFEDTNKTLYYIRDNGTVFTIKKSSGNVRELKLVNRITSRYDKQGYLCIGLVVSGKTVTRYVHRLVAEYFCNKVGPKNGLEVNHKDGNKHNNHISNLEWVSRRINMLEAHRLGLIASPDFNGVKNPNYGNTKLSDECVKRAYGAWKEGDGETTLKSLSNFLGVSDKYLSARIIILKNKGVINE